MKKISVLHIVLSTLTGGMENAIYNLCANSDRGKLDIQVACIEEIGALSEKFKALGIETVLIPKMVSGFSLLYPRELIHFIEQSKCDIVHTHSGCWTKVASAIAHLPNVKLVYTEHGRTFPDPKLGLVLDRIAGLATDRVVAVADTLNQYLIEKVGVSPKKVITIRNGIDTERFKRSEISRSEVRTELGYSPENIIIGIVARLAPVKNHEYLFRTVKIVFDENPQSRLLVIGDGELRGSLESLAQSTGLANKIKFIGDRPDVSRLLSGIDILTLSSLSEGTSLTLLEGMSCQLPVVATNIGGNPGVIKNGQTGFLVDLDKPELYADSFKSLINSKELRQTMGEKARKDIELYWSIAACVKSYQELYEELVK